MSTLRVHPRLLGPLLAVLAALASVSHPADGSAQVPAGAEARLRALYQEGAFAPRSFRADWLPDGSGYTRLERTDGADGFELVRYDAASGARTVLASARQLQPADASSPLDVESYALSAGIDAMLFRTLADGAGRTADLWTFERSSGLLRKVAEGVDGGSLPVPGRPTDGESCSDGAGTST